MLSKITRVHEQVTSVQSAGKSRAVQASSRGNVAITKSWKLVIYLAKYWCHAMDSASDKTIFGSSQIKD